MRVDFYHLTRDPAPAALVSIARRVLESGERMLAVSGEEAMRTALSDALWSAPGFLANGLAGTEDDAQQPILIADTVGDPANGAGMVALFDGQWRDDALRFERTFLLFDEATIEGARSAWRSLGERDGIERHYWKQVDGRWREGP